MPVILHMSHDCVGTEIFLKIFRNYFITLGLTFIKIPLDIFNVSLLNTNHQLSNIIFR